MSVKNPRNIREMTSKTDVFQSLAECGQQLSRCDIQKQLVPHVCGNNQEGTFGDS